MFDHFLHSLLPTVQHFQMLGYWMALLAALLETAIGIGLILPGSTFILLLGALAAQGAFDFGDLVWFAVAGAVIGDNLNYYLGAKFGARWIKEGVWFLKPGHLAKAHVFFDTHGAKSVFLGRFIPSVKEVVPFIAGSVGMRQRTFFVWNVLGAIGWGLQWVGAGYLFAQSLNLARTWLSRAGFMFAALLACFLIFSLIKRFIKKRGPYFFSLAASLWHSVASAVLQNSEVRKIVSRHPRFFAFVKKRFDTHTLFGFPATVLALAFGYVLILFGGIIEDLVTADVIVTADVRIEHLLAVFRNPVLTKIFFWITLLGKWQVVTVFLLAAVALLWMQRHRVYILPLLTAVAGSQVFTHLGKHIFHRPRPLVAMYAEHSFSFPSGHATIAVAFYAFVTFILMRAAKRWETRVNVCFAGLAVVLLIGFSRLYLGVHYLSDVWGGYLVGALWLIAGISLSEWLRTRQAQTLKASPKVKIRWYSAAVLIASLLFYAGFAVRYTPLPARPVAPQSVVVHRVQMIFADNRLKYTETIVGQKRRPICFVVAVVNDLQFIHVLEEAGWNLADDISFSSMLKMAKLSLLERPYPTAPVSPSFWDTRVNDFAFRRAEDTGTDHRRHFARFWKTRYVTPAGRHYYAGTVSVHKNFFKRMLNQKTLDANRERDLLVADLKKAKAASTVSKLRLADPALVESFLHGRLFWDGIVDVIALP